MAMKGITPRAWQIWIPGYEGRYLWNFATQRVMSCVYPGATTPTNLHTGASNPGYTLKREIDVRLGGKGTYYKHVDLANWLNPMNPRNKKPGAVAASADDSESLIDAAKTFIVVGLDDNLCSSQYAKFTGKNALSEAIDAAKRYTIEKEQDFQIYQFVADTKFPKVQDIQIFFSADASVRLNQKGEL